MNDVCFNITGIEFAYKDSIKYEKQLCDSVSGIVELTKHLEGEISAFRSFSQSGVSEVGRMVAEVNSLVSCVESKMSSAQSQKKQELPPPSPPSIPANATPEERQAIMDSYNQMRHRVEEMNRKIREQNGRVDSYVAKCESTISKLRQILSRLTAIESAMKSEKSRVESAVKGDLSAVKNAIRPMPAISKAMTSFTGALYQTLESAKELYALVPSDIPPPAYGDRDFRFINRHSFSGKSSVGSVFGGGTHSSHSSLSYEKKAEDAKTTRDSRAAMTDGCLISETDGSVFIEMIDGLTSFKMPSANLYRLGGKRFVSKINALGYRVKSMPDGRITDEHGIMCWEKKND